MKDAWPVEAKAYGGRHYRGDYVDQNFDSYTIEYTFADGSEADSRRPDDAGLPQRVRQLCARHARVRRSFLDRAHWPAGPGFTRDQTQAKEQTSCGTAARSRSQNNPYQVEWDDLIDGDPQRTSRTTKSSAAPRPAWSRRWDAWRATPVRW